MKVAIFGCGPAGLLAAHAAALYEVEFNIYSRKLESPVWGAQYLHHPVEGITGERDGLLSYVKIGEESGYAKKVYGDPSVHTSWEHYGGTHEAWSLDLAYEKLRKLYWHQVVDTEITPESVSWFCDKYDIVLSSVPANILCLDRKYEHSLHDFHSEPIFLAPLSMINDVVDNVVIYSGREEDSWYRTSRIFGHSWTEYPNRGVGSMLAARIGLGALTRATLSFDAMRLKQGIKPLFTDCDCHITRSNFYRIGRFGKWQKKELVSDAYLDAIKIIGSFVGSPPDGHDILEQI